LNESLRNNEPDRVGTGCRAGLKRFPKETAVNKALGVILIVLGLFGLAWGGFTYTTQEKVIDIGPIHATREKTHNIPLPPVAGAVALVGGIVLLAVGKKE
jgi:uncharacterized membrane protein HdeD (DUF308 family)